MTKNLEQDVAYFAVKLRRFVAPSLLAAVVAGVGGCGTRVPELQEAWASADEAPLFVHSLVRSVHCEVRNAVVGIIEADKKLAARGYNGGHRITEWLDSWGVQIALSIMVEEQSSLNPGASLNQVLRSGTTIFPGGATVVTGQQRSLGFGGGLSSTATRINKLNSFYTVAELQADRPDCSRERLRGGSLLIQEDLKTREWLSSVVFVADTRDVGLPVKLGPPFNQGVMSHQIKFQVTSSGNVTPSWKFVNVAVNQGNTPLFSTKRDRTHDLTLTFGPTAVTEKSRARPGLIVVGTRQLAPEAANSALASEIGVAVSNSIRSALQQ